MPQSAINIYLERLSQRIAEWKLAQVELHLASNMKQKDLRSMLRKWSKAAEGVAKKVRGAPAALLKMIGIGVQHVAKTESGSGGSESGHGSSGLGREPAATTKQPG